MARKNKEGKWSPGSAPGPGVGGGIQRMGKGEEPLGAETP